MSFFDRYSDCCKQKGISPVSQAAAENLHCSKANISSLAKSGSSPRGDIIMYAAQMLDVSADYLLGLIDTPHPVQTSPDLTADEQHVLEVIQKLNPAGLAASLSMLDGIERNPQYNNNFSGEEL